MMFNYLKIRRLVVCGQEYIFYCSIQGGTKGIRMKRWIRKGNGEGRDEWRTKIKE